MQEFFHSFFAEKRKTFIAGYSVLGFLCGAFGISGFYPFACAVYMCSALSGGYEVFAAAGTIAGLLSRGAFLHILPLVLCIVIKSLWCRKKAKKLAFADALLMLAVCELSELSFMHSDIKECVLTAIMCAVSEIAFFVMYNGVNTLSVLTKRKRLASDTEILYVSLLFGFFVFLLTPYSLHTLNTARVACGVIILLMSLTQSPVGAYIAVLSASGCAYSYADGKIDIAFTGICAVSLIFCSLAGRKKAKVAAMYIVTSLLLSLLTSNAITATDIFASAVIFLCIPQKATDLICAFFAVKRTKGGAAYKKRIDTLAKVAGDISDTLCMNEMQGDGALAKRQLIAFSGLLEGIYDERAANCRLSVDVGIACIPKTGCAHTGDSVKKAVFGEKAVIAVSDGMGSGLLAHNESAACVEAFLDIQRAGFDTCDSIDYVNRRLIARDGELYATLDALVIDMYSGICTAVKLGSPPSYILRDGKVTELDGEALPLGIIESVSPSVKKLKAEVGDVFIIMTDGVQDVLSSDIYAGITEKAAQAHTPKELANALLDMAVRDRADDDMSVVCVYISD